MTEQANMNLGFYSFLRLVGCEYFRSVASKFNYQIQSARANLLFNIALVEAAMDNKKAHLIWLDKIRSAVSLQSENEDHYLPSTDALEYHWKRVCWVAQVWQSACINHIDFPKVEDYGWTLSNGILSVVWDSEDNFQRCEKLVRFWTRGCQCRKGCVRNCGCRRIKKSCGPGCLCIGSCKNAPSNPSINNLVLALGNDSGQDSLSVIGPIDPDFHDHLTDDESDIEEGDLSSE